MRLLKPARSFLMKKLLKALIIGTWRRLIPKEARNSLRLWLMLDMPDRAPRLIENFAEQSVLVLAPHMDDEIIGPGGAVALHLKAGAKVCFVYMTDGRAGDPEMLALGLEPQDLDRRKTELAEIRKTESFRAAQVIGVKDLEFLGGPDGALAESRDIVAALAGVLDQRRPEIIYLPALTDNHRDHWATNRILRAALLRLPPELTRDLLIRGYEVWTPLPANCMADITPVADAKKQAIECFTTQTRFVDYAWTAMGLNQYRSMVHLHGRGFAEAFLESTVEEYREMFDRICLNHPAVVNTPMPRRMVEPLVGVS